MDEIINYPDHSNSKVQYITLRIYSIYSYGKDYLRDIIGMKIIVSKKKKKHDSNSIDGC